MVHLHSKAPAVAGCIAAHKVCQAICLSADRASSRQLLHNLPPASALWLNELCLQTCCIMLMQALATPAMLATVAVICISAFHDLAAPKTLHSRLPPGNAAVLQAKPLCHSLLLAIFVSFTKLTEQGCQAVAIWFVFEHAGVPAYSLTHSKPCCLFAFDMCNELVRVIDRVSDSPTLAKLVPEGFRICVSN